MAETGTGINEHLLRAHDHPEEGVPERDLSVLGHYFLAHIDNYFILAALPTLLLSFLPTQDNIDNLLRFLLVKII